MKMRDKKKKKVNRIVKAGLALLCAGALLGGALLYGGSVRVKAEDDVYYASEDVKQICTNSEDGDTYVVYEKKDEYKLESNKEELAISGYADDLKTNVYIIWDTRKDEQDQMAEYDEIENQKDFIGDFANECSNLVDWAGNVNIWGCKIPLQTSDIEFKKINNMLNDNQAATNDNQSYPLQDTVTKLATDDKYEWSLKKEECNIVVVMTPYVGDNDCDYSSLTDAAIVYKVNMKSNDDDEKDGIIPYINWKEELVTKISGLSCVKVTNDNADDVTKDDFVWKKESEGDKYRVASKIEQDGAYIYITADDDSESYGVKAIDEDISIENVSYEGDKNTTKWKVNGNYKLKGDQDSDDDCIKIKINNDDYTTELIEDNGLTYSISGTEIKGGEAYIYIEASDGEIPGTVDAIISDNGDKESLKQDTEYENEANITCWILSGSYEETEDSEDSIQIEVDGVQIGPVNLKIKNDDGTVCIEHITSTDEESYIFFSNKDAVDGNYKSDRNSSLYNEKLRLTDSDAEPKEDEITYNIVWDLGAESYSEGTPDFDTISSEVEELSNNVGKNKVNIIDCNGDKIDLSGDDTQKLEPDGDRKLTKEKFEKILSDSGSPKDAYIVLTDVDGATEVKDTISKDTDKLVYWINIGDPEKASIEKAIIPTAITDDEENGISKWDNAKNLIKSSIVFKFAGIRLTTDENGDSTTPVSITVDSVQITNVNIYEVDDNKNIIDKIWSKLRLWQKILISAGAAVVVILIVIMIIVSTRRKKARKRRKAAGGIPHGSPSSSPDVQLRSGVSPTAQTNVLARRAGEQNMQGMQNTVPANNTKQIQIQIIGRNPKIINTYINGSIFVGRANTCDVFINDATISRQHFALECVNGEVFIQPLVATNGTKLNGQRINDKHPLYPNDRIQIGTIGIVVRW